MGKQVEVKKIDSQGRLILPTDWRELQLKGTSEVYVIKHDGFLKVVPKRKVDLRKFFDRAKLGVDAIDDWDKFEKAIWEKRK